MSIAAAIGALPLAARRVIAVAVIPILLGLGLVSACAAVREISNAQDEWRYETRALLAQTRTAPDIRSSLDRRLGEVRTSVLWSRFYRPHGNGSSAMALHADVASILANAQVSAQSLTAMPLEPDGAVTRVGVRFSGSVRTDQLQGILAALNAHPRYLRVARIAVVAPQMQTPVENPPLAVTMDVFGYELAATAFPQESSAPLAMVREP